MPAAAMSCQPKPIVFILMVWLSTLSPLLFAAADTITFTGPAMTETRASYTGGIDVAGMTAGGTLTVDGGTMPSGSITLGAGVYTGSTVIFKQLQITSSEFVLFAPAASGASLASATVIFDRCTITMTKPGSTSDSSFVFDLGTQALDNLHFEVSGTTLTGAFNDKNGGIIRVRSSHNNANLSIKDSDISYKHGRGDANHFELFSVEGGPNIGAVYTVEGSTITAACEDGVSFDCATYGAHFDSGSVGGFTITMSDSTFTSHINTRIVSLATRDVSNAVRINVLGTNVSTNGALSVPVVIAGGYEGIHLKMARCSVDASAAGASTAIVRVTGPATGRGYLSFSDTNVTYGGTLNRRFLEFTGATTGTDKGLDVSITRCRIKVYQGMYSKPILVLGAVANDISIAIADSELEVQSTHSSARTTIFFSHAVTPRLKFSITNSKVKVIGQKLSVAWLPDCPQCVVEIQTSDIEFQDHVAPNSIIDAKKNLRDSRILLRGNAFKYGVAGTLLIAQAFSTAIGPPAEIDIGCPGSGALASSVNHRPVAITDVVSQLRPYVIKCRGPGQPHLPTRSLRQHWLKTVAGNGGQGSAVGNIAASQVDKPSGIAYDSIRDEVYFAQYDTATIVKLNVLTWTTSVYSGSGTSVSSITNGPVAGATFGSPTHMVFDTHNDRLIVSDGKTHHVRGINVAGGNVYTIAGSGAAGSADGAIGTGHLDTPGGVALSMDNATVLIACEGNNAVRIAPAAGSGSLSTKYGSVTVAGFENGAAATARMTAPVGIVTARSLSMAFVTNAGRCIRTINLVTDYVGHLAGDCSWSGVVDGMLTEAMFDSASGLAMGKGDDVLYVSEKEDHTIRRLDLLDKRTAIVAGKFKTAGNVDGTIGTSRVTSPSCLTSDYRTGLIYACSDRKILSLGSRHYVKVFAGTPLQATATNGAIGTGSFKEIAGVDHSVDVKALFVASKATHQIALVTMLGEATYVAGVSSASSNVDADGLSAQFSRIDDILMDNAYQLLYVGAHTALRTMTIKTPYTVATVGGHASTAGAVNGDVGTHRVGDFHQLGHGPDLNKIYFVDKTNHAIRTFQKVSKKMETYAGQLQVQGTVDGPAASSKFDTPMSIGYRRLTNVLYVGGPSSIRTLDLATRVVATVLGAVRAPGYTYRDSPGADFHVENVAHIRFTPDDETMLVSDASGGCIRVIDVNTLTARDPIGAPGYLGWVSGGPSPATVRGTLTAAELTAAYDGPADVARVMTAGVMPKTQPPGVDGIVVADAKAGVLLQYTGDGIDDLNTGKTLDSPPHERWYYSRVAGETTGSCVQGAVVNHASNPFAARFNVPVVVAIDRPGNAVYTADYFRYTIRRIDLGTMATTTIAGIEGTSGAANGPGTSATFGYFNCIVMDDVRRRLYMYATAYTIRMLKVDTPGAADAVATFSGVSGSSGVAEGPLGIGTHSEIIQFCHDGVRSRVKYFWTTEGSCLVRRVDGSGAIETIAGRPGECRVQDGTTDARFTRPLGIAISPGRNTAFITEHSHCLRRMSLTAPHAVTSIFCTTGGASGKFPGTHLWNPSQLIISHDGGSLFVSEWQGSTIRRIDLDTWDSELIAGAYGRRATGWDDGLPGQSRLNRVWAMDLDPTTGDLWVADAFTCSIGLLTNSSTMHHVSGDPSITNPVTTQQEEGPSDASRYRNLGAVAYDPVKETAYLGSWYGRCDIVHLPTAYKSFLVGNAGSLTATAPTTRPRLSSNSGSCYSVFVDVPARQVYFGLRGSGSSAQAIYRTTIPAAADLELVAGKATAGYAAGLPGTSAWNIVAGMEAIDGEDLLYVCDRLNHGVRTLHKTTKMSSLRIVGCGRAETRDGTLLSGCFYRPHAIIYSRKRRGFYVSEINAPPSGNRGSVRFFSLEQNALWTIAGAADHAGRTPIQNGRFTESTFDTVTGLALAPSEDELFFASYFNEIGRINLVSGHVSQFAGSYVSKRPLYNGAATMSRLRPFGLAVADHGEMLVTDESMLKKATLFPSSDWASVGDSKYTVTSLIGPKYGDDAIRETVAGVVVVPAHDAVYVTLPQRSVIVKIKMTTHEATEVLGRAQLYADKDEVRQGPTATDVTFARPSAITHDPATDTLYIAEYTAGRVRSAFIPFSTTTTLTSVVGAPAGLAVGHLSGNTSSSKVLLITDDSSHVVMAVGIPSGTTVTTVAGVSGTSGYKNGAAATALFSEPTGVVFHEPTKAIYVADKGNHLIRRVQLATSTVTTVAGISHTRGHIDGGFTYARFDEPFGVAIPCPTNVQNDLSLIVTDAGGRGVRRLDFSTSTVTTMAGRLGFRSAVKDGNGTAARFGTLQGIAAHPCRCGLMYAADATFGRVVEIAEHGLQAFLGNATLNGSLPNGRHGTDAVISDPRGIGYDRSGGRLFVASRGFNVIYAVNISTRVPTIIAGRLQSPGTADGALGTNRLDSPGFILYDRTKNVLFISDEGSRTLRQLSFVDLELTTLAGAPGTAVPVNGNGAAARFNYPTGIAPAWRANCLLVGDYHGATIRRYLFDYNHLVQTRVGKLNDPGHVDGPTSVAKLTKPLGLVRHRRTLRLFIACGDGTVRVGDPEPALILSTLVGLSGAHADTDGDFATARLNHPTAITTAGEDGAGETLLYVSTVNSVRRIHLIDNKVDTLVGSNTGPGLRRGAFSKTGTIHGLAVDKNEVLYIAHDAGEVSSVRPPLPAAVEKHVAEALAADRRPNDGTVPGDLFGANDKRGDYAVAVVAGLPGTPGLVPGPARTTARLQQPTGSAIHVKQSALYVASNTKHCIMKLDLAMHVVSTVSGLPGARGTSDGDSVTARWANPMDVAFSPADGDDPTLLYVAAYGGHTIRTVDISSGTVTTIAGSGVAGTTNSFGTAAKLNGPVGLAFDGTGERLLVANLNGANLQEITMSNVLVAHVAGSTSVPEQAHRDGRGDKARFDYPAGIQYRKSTGDFYVACRGSIRLFDASSVVTTVAGPGNVGSPTFGPAEAATFEYLGMPAIDPHDDSRLYITDHFSNTVSVMDLDSKTLTLIAGIPGRLGDAYEGPANRTFVARPSGATVHPTTGELYFTSLTAGYVGKIFNTQGAANKAAAVNGGAVNNGVAIRTVAGTGTDGATATADALKVEFGGPTHVSYNARRRVMYIADPGNCRIHEYRRESKDVRVLLGSPTTRCPGSVHVDGPAATAVLQSPVRVEYLAVTDTLYWVENRRVARVPLDTMVTETLAGKTTAGHVDGNVGTSTCTHTMGLCVTRDVKTIYVVDNTKHSLRAVDLAHPQTKMTTLVGAGTVAGNDDGPQATATLTSPMGVTMRHSTGIVYIVANLGVRYYDPARKAVFTLAGVSGENTETVAGSIVNGGPARFLGTADIAFSYDENDLFVVADQLMRIDMASMTLSFAAGHPTKQSCQDGIGTTAGQTNSQGLTLAETSIWIASTDCQTIRQVDAVDLGAHDAATLRTTVSTVAGNISGRLGSKDSAISTDTMLTDAQGVAIDQARGVAYVSDATSLRLLSFDRFSMSTLIGASVAPSASSSCPAFPPPPALKRPSGLLLDSTRTMLFIAEHEGHRVLKSNVTAHSNVSFVVYAGTGVPGSMDHATGHLARLNGPTALAWTVDAAPPALLIADEYSHTIRSVAASSLNAVTTIVGKLGTSGHKDGTGASAEFDRPAGIAVLRPRRMSAAGAAFVACRGSHTLRRIDLSTNAVTTVMGRPYVAGIGSGTSVTGVFYTPGSVTADEAGTGLYVSDSGSRSVKHVFVDDSLGPVESSTFAGYPSSLSDEPATTPARDGSREDALFTSHVGQVALLTGAMAGQEGDVAMLVTDRGTVRIAFTADSAVTTVSGHRSYASPRTGDKFRTTFNNPVGIAHDPQQDRLFVSSADSFSIVSVNIRTGISSLVAGRTDQPGNANGAGTVATFKQLAQLLFDAKTSVLYACDAGSNNIRSISTIDNTVSNVAGSDHPSGLSGTANGVGASASFHSPVCLALDSTREHLLICDRDNHVIRRVQISTRDVTLLSGAFGAAGIADGAPLNARYSKPTSIVRRAKTGMLYIACSEGHVIREMDPSTFVVTRIVGTGAAGTTDGQGTAAVFTAPSALAVSPDQRYLYVLSSTIEGVVDGDGALRQIDLDDSNEVKTVGGKVGTNTPIDGPTVETARFGSTSQMVIDPTGGFFLTSTLDHTVKRMAGIDGFGTSETNTSVVTVAGQIGVVGTVDAAGAKALLNTASGVSVSVKHNAVFFAETSTCLIRRLSLETYTVSRAAGLFPVSCGTANGALLTVAQFDQPNDVLVDDASDKVYVSELSSAIRRIDLVGDSTDLFAGTHTAGFSDGIGGQIGEPAGMALSQDGTLLYFCDKTNNRIRSVFVATKMLATAVGAAAGFADGIGSAALMNKPHGIARRPGTDLFYFADTNSNAVRIFDPSTNAVSTLLGWGADAGVAAGTFDSKPGMWAPTGLTFGNNDTMYVTSSDADAVWKVDLRGRGIITTIGSGPRRRRVTAVDSTDAATASFRHPASISVDPRTGELYVADQESHAIRRVFRTDTPSGFVKTILGNTSAFVLNARDGSASSSAQAQLFQPSRGVSLRQSVITGRAVDSDETILIVESTPGLIRRVWPASGRVRSFIGKRVGFSTAPTTGAASEVGLNTPGGICVDQVSRVMFIASRGGHRVLKYDFATDVISLLYGDGTAAHQDGDTTTPAQVNEPDGVELSKDRSELWVTSRGSHVIRRTLVTIGLPSTSTPYGTVGSAGTAPGTDNSGKFNTPSDIKLHKRTNTLYVVSSGASVISSVDIASGSIAPVAGADGSTGAVDGPAAAARFNAPSYAAFGVREGIDDDTLFIADEGSHLIRRLGVDALTVGTVVGDADHVTVGAYVDGLPKQSRCDQPGQPILMKDGSMVFADTAANVLRSLVFDPAVATGTQSATATTTETLLSSQTELLTGSATLDYPPTGQLLEDGAATAGRETNGAPWTFPGSNPWRVLPRSSGSAREFHTDSSGTALARVYIPTGSYTGVINRARDDGATAYHAVLKLSFRAAAHLPIPLLPTVRVTLACFASQAAANAGTAPLTKATALFKSWQGHKDARRQRSSAVRYPLSTDCNVVSAEVRLTGFIVITNAELHFATGVVPDDVFSRLVTPRPWIDETSVTPVDSLSAAVPALVAIGTDTTVPTGSTTFNVIPPLVPGFAEGGNVFQCDSSLSTTSRIYGDVTLSADQIAAVANGTLRVTIGALVESVDHATLISIRAVPSNLVLTTSIPPFAATAAGHLSWIGVPDVALPPDTTSVALTFAARRSGAACGILDALLFGFRSELSDRSDDTADIATALTPPDTSFIPDGGAEGPSNTAWPDDSTWRIAGPGASNAAGARQRPLWLRGGRFGGSEGRRSFVVPPHPMVIPGREHSRDTADKSISFGGSDAAGNVTADVTAYAHAIDESRLDFQLSFIFAAPASSVSTMYPSHLSTADQAVVDAMKVKVFVTAAGLGWDGAATVLPGTSLRPSAGSYGRTFRATGRLPKLARSLTLTLVLCPGCAVDDVRLFMKERDVSSTFALAPVAEVSNSAALNADFDGSGVSSWTVTSGSVTTALKTDASVFPADAPPYPSARSIAKDYIVGAEVFSVCSAATAMSQDVTLPPSSVASINAHRAFIQVSFRLVSAASVPLSVRVEAMTCSGAPPAGPGLDCGGHIVAEALMSADPFPGPGVGSPGLAAPGGTVSPAVVELETAAAFLPKTTTALKIVITLPATSGPSDCALFDELKVSLVSQADRTMTATVRVGRLSIGTMQALFYATLTARFIEPNPGGNFRSRYEADEAYRAEVRAAVLQEISTVSNIDLAALWVGPKWPLFPA